MAGKLFCCRPQEGIPLVIVWGGPAPGPSGRPSQQPLCPVISGETSGSFSKQCIMTQILYRKNRPNGRFRFKNEFFNHITLICPLHLLLYTSVIFSDMIAARCIQYKKPEACLLKPPLLVVDGHWVGEVELFKVHFRKCARGLPLPCTSHTLVPPSSSSSLHTLG